ncbi:AraC family transcriptional regulator [Roseovarius sp. B08]|uniref:helix-turn-helix transcriptional regulator n=1 Tax=Roseovarius sp. B08 TaxID=3449223 RepID=UPI003EDC9843
MDPLSQLLHLASAEAAVSTGLIATGRWAVHVPPTSALKCNLVREGHGLLEVGGMRYELGPGDCFLVAPERPFLIGTDLSCPRPAAEVFAAGDRGPFARLNGGEGPGFRCLGGRMELGDMAVFLTEALPPVILLRDGLPAGKRIAWLLDRLEAELAEAQPGSGALAASAMRMIFVELMRTLPQDMPNGWLAALTDPRIGPVLRAIHDDPTHPWTLDALARRANLSRSQFAARFRVAVGRAPMDYILRWRMALARQALSRPGATVSQVAADLGYASESAFGAAFRRVTGTSPRRAVAAARRR